MFGSQRLDAIKRIVREKKYVDVSYLSELFNVSEVTIRRDLNKLEEEGFLVRSFGGASITPDSSAPEASPPPQKQSDLDTVEMAQIALRQIAPGSVVFIGSGDICVRMAEKIDMPLTVVTNSLRTAAALAQKRDVTAILTGGNLAPDGESALGAMTIQNLQNICISACFICVDGFSAEKGYSMASFEHCSLIRFLRASIPECYALVSADRLGRNSSFILGNAGFFTGLITSFGIREDMKAALQQQHVRLYTALG